MTAVTRVKTVYGDYFHVSTEHLADQRRIQLPLFTRTGKRWDETVAGQRAIRRHEASTLHRENIAPVVEAVSVA